MFIETLISVLTSNSLYEGSLASCVVALKPSSIELCVIDQNTLPPTSNWSFFQTQFF